MTETLKGGVSYNNYKYVWHTEGKNICAVCASMEGEEYASEEDIPDRPHPNCKCYVDIEEIGEGSGSATTDRPDNDEEDSENRDPEEPKEPEKPRKKTNRLDELIGDFMSLQDEAYALESEIDSITEKDNEASKIIATFSQNYITEIRKLNYTIQSHVSVLESMKDDEEEPSNSVIELYENYYYTCESHLQTLISCFEKELDRIKNKEKLKNDFQKDYKKHSELKDLNQYVYHRERQDLLHGYKLVAEVHQQDSGFDGYVFEKGKEAVVLYEGSNDRKDYIYDVTDIRSHKNPQLEDA